MMDGSDRCRRRRRLVLCVVVVACLLSFVVVVGSLLTIGIATTFLRLLSLALPLETASPRNKMKFPTLASLILALLAAAAATSAFTSTTSTSVRRSCFGVSASSPTRRSMFSTENDEAAKSTSAAAADPSFGRPLASIDEADDASSPGEDGEDDSPKSVYKNMNTGETVEVKWVDPAAQANTK